MMDQPAAQDQPQDRPPEDAAASGGQAPPATRGAGRRIVAALLLLPWILGYGSVGAWAVAFGARNMAAGLQTVDAGYTRMVTPGGVILVGVLLLAAFATLMAAGLLLIYGSRRRGAWITVAVAAAALTAGAVWAGVRGELVLILWVFFFFGLVYALGVAVVGAWRAGPRGRILRP